MLKFLELITGKVIALLCAMALLAFVLLAIGFASGVMLLVIAVTIPLVVLRILFSKKKPEINIRIDRS